MATQRARNSSHWFLLICLALICTSASLFALDPVVRTESGLVRGAGTDVIVFKGIPFAAPPVGPLRWKASQPAAPWEGTRDALEYCATCPQPPLLPGIPPKQSEDCLGLNIWTPAKTSKDKLPVMVWIHGGGFLLGSGTQAHYEGEVLAREGVVVVTINYRLGIFGFLAHPELSGESPQHVSGNYGLLDQIATLKWVQRNIANFGGDPKNVTIFGESAGGASVFSLLASPLAKGLFARAISESGTWVFTAIRHLRESAYGYEAAEQAGAATGDLASLRSMSFQDIVKLKHPKPDVFFDFSFANYRPVVDGWVFPSDPSELFERGDFNQVPLLTGTNADEAALFMSMGMLSGIKTPDAYRAWLTASFGEGPGAKIAKAYPTATDADVRDAVKQVITDFIFVESTRAIALSAQSKVPVYVYRFSRVNAIGRATKMGAHHGAEIAYIFGTFNTPMINAPGQSYDDSDRALGKAMRGAWVQFAKTGNPNGAGLAEWPAYKAGSERCLDFGDSVTAIPLPGASRIDLLYSVFKELRSAGQKKQQLSRN